MPHFSDDEFFDAAAKVVFPVAKTTLPLDAPLFNELSTRIIPRINADSLQLVRLMLRGAASPEGPVELNKRLGQQRVQALFDFLNSRMEFPVVDSLFTIETDIEDYNSLLLLMRRAGDPDYALVKGLCDRFLAQDLVELKKQLQGVNQGQLWRRLLATYFPDLRTARFIMFFKKVPVPEITDMIPADLTVEPPTLPVPDVVEAEVVVPPVVEPEPVAVVPDTLYRRELLSIKTNLLLDLAYMPGYDRWCPIPNVAVEYYPKRGHFTFGGSFDMPWWQHYDDHKFFQFRNYQLEARYYLKSSIPYEPYEQPYKAPAFKGFYLQAYVHTAIYGICFDADRGWEGEGVGGGIGLGYVLPLSRNGHWRLEFGAQFGYFHTKYDPYQYENPVDPTYTDNLYYYKWTLSPSLFKERQYRFNWFGPTRVGITLSYDLLYRRIQKRGVSFKSKERRTTYEE